MITRSLTSHALKLWASALQNKGFLSGYATSFHDSPPLLISVNLKLITNPTRMQYSTLLITASFSTPTHHQNNQLHHKKANKPKNTIVTPTIATCATTSLINQTPCVKQLSNHSVYPQNLTSSLEQLNQSLPPTLQ